MNGAFIGNAPHQWDRLGSGWSRIERVTDVRYSTLVPNLGGAQRALDGRVPVTA